jgi:glycosyltransferase involved in cell wall biosynthesis
MGLSCILCNCDKRNRAQKCYRLLRQAVQNQILRACKNINFITLSGLNDKVVKAHLPEGHYSCRILKNPVDAGQAGKVEAQANSLYLFIGKFSAEKGVELFCRAVSDLGLPAAALGSGPLLERCRKNYPAVKFPGWLSHEAMQPFIAKARALVFPSLWYEGSPVTIFEAQSRGLPCIVSNQCAAAETIKDSVNGFVFESGSLESLKEAIKKIKSIDITEMSEAAYTGIKTGDYSLETHIRGLLDIYNA